MANENLAISADNFADDGLYFIWPGWWVPSLPITNLADNDPRHYARTAGVDPAGTNFLLDLTRQRGIGMVALINHNMRPGAQWRVLFSADGVTTIADTGNMDVWQTVETFGQLPWGVFQWGGVLSPEVAAAWPINSLYIPDDTIMCRYIKVYLIDPANTDGYVQAGRFWAGPVWRPSVNAQFPFRYTWEDDSQISRSRGGRTFVDERARRRVISFDLDYIGEAEMMGQVFDLLDRGRGIARDCVVVPKPTQLDQLFRQAIYCRQRDIGEISEVFLDRHQRQLVFEENI